MNIYITGPNGRVGREMVKRGCRPLKCDITDKFEVEAQIGISKPDWIVHLAGKSEVDFCEREENKEIVIATNLTGAFNIFDVAEQHGVRVVAISSDHVFNGKHGNYKEADTKNIGPVNYYGQSKLSMEAIAHSFDNVKIVRSSVLFTDDRPLVLQYLDPLRLDQEIHVPSFQQRSFMYLKHFVDALLEYIPLFDVMPKILHVAGGPHPISWYDFVCSMAEVYKLDHHNIYKKTSSDKDFPGAPRPQRAGLNVTLAKKLGLTIPDYRDGLKLMYADGLVKELGYV